MQVLRGPRGLIVNMQVLRGPRGGHCKHAGTEGS